jgi:N-acyl-L-homoserine lactone synthetase
MHFVSGAQEKLPRELYARLARYRHTVFVERLGWPLEAEQGLECDQFDRPDTLYVIAQQEDGRISGCARLLPTTRPYLLGEVFPELLNGLTPPCSPDVWELSRFAAVDTTDSTKSPLSQFSSSIAVTLLREAVACAAIRGASWLISVSPVGVERLLRRAGFRAHRAGPPRLTDGQPIIACWISVDSIYEVTKCLHAPPQEESRW